MEPEDPQDQQDTLDGQESAPTTMERLMGILRYALLPAAAVALVAAMFIFIPNLGQSDAAQDGDRTAPLAAVSAPPSGSPSAAPSAAAPASATPTAPTPAASTTPASTPTPAPAAPPTPAPVAPPAPAPVAPPTPTPTGPGEAAGAQSAPVSPNGVAPTRITVEAAGIDVAVLPLVPSADELAAQSIVPPITDDGYWLTSYGAPGPGSTDTTYIAGHSWEGREAPFDLFSTNTEPGDTIVLDTMAGPLTYVVDAVTTHDKNSLKDSDIWNITPNRLVIISCFTEDPWGKNVVVTASPVT